LWAVVFLCPIYHIRNWLSSDFYNPDAEILCGRYCSHTNVSKLSHSKGYARETGREAVENGLRIFPVSRSRIPKIPDFC
jgi:hypothetical protein